MYEKINKKTVKVLFALGSALQRISYLEKIL